MRETIDLCGLWRFQPDLLDRGEQNGYHQPDLDVARWREVAVPCPMDLGAPGLASYEGVGWYRRRLQFPTEWRGRRVAIRFQGINHQARVWLNGEPLGEHLDPFLPFECAAGAAVRWGEDNLLAVRVDGRRRAGEVPGLQRGWRPYAGILREVTLEACSPCRIDAVAVNGRPGPQGGALSLQVRIANGTTEQAQIELQVEVHDAEDAVRASLVAGPLVVDAGGEGLLAARGEVVGAEPWSPAHPALYTVRAYLLLDGEPVDEHQVRFGFRHIEADGGLLLLNGEPVFIAGFNRHEDSPRTGMCPDLGQVRRDLLDMKDLGANFVRLAHYPHHPGELDLCDELGLLAMGEIPLYWWDGRAEGAEACARKLEAARRQLAALIERDRNHPSVIFWSASNETHEERPEVAAGNRELVQLARELDPSRLAVHVSDHWREHPNFDADDVLCVNGYPGLDARRQALNPAPAEAGRWWREHLARLHQQYPGKPILITEFGHPALEDTHGHDLGEEAQALAIEAEFAAFDAPYLCGAVVWCYADHPWPEAGFLDNLTTSPYGILSRCRRRKQAYAVVRRLFRERLGHAPRPPGRGISTGGQGVEMIRPHLRDIPIVEFPAGFRVRPLRPGEGGLWEDIVRDAEEHLDIRPGLFEDQFGRDLPATTWRCFFIEDERGIAVATISAWYNRCYRGSDYGQVHWVATRPAYQRRGLGRAGLSFVLRQLARWHQRCFLGTSTARLPAIRMYLDFGFLPDLQPEGAREAWRQVQETLPHPALDALEW